LLYGPESPAPIPIPAIIFNKIAFPLQLFASRCAVWSMSVIGIPVLRQGNVIELKPLNSFDTKKLILSAVPIAILTNASRVSGTGILSHYYGTGVADGFFHTFSGWAIYIVAFLLLFAVGWILDRFKPSEPSGKSGGVVEDKSSPEHKSVSTTTTVLPAEGVD
jgi:exosortase/archaeosortase family protein